MKIEEIKAIVIQNDATRECFTEEDIVEIVGIDNGKERTIKGRIENVLPRGFEKILRIDTSERYRRSHIDIPEELIKSIKKIPD